jgi:hypothetical protein
MILTLVFRRPVFLVSTFFSMVCNIGGVFCHSYGAQMTTGVLTAIFIRSAVVAEVFFSRQRAQ